MAMSAIQTVEDGVIKVGGAEVGRGTLMLLPSAIQVDISLEIMNSNLKPPWRLLRDGGRSA